MPLSSMQHLTATCTVMFISALGAGYLPTLVKAGPLLPGTYRATEPKTPAMLTPTPKEANSCGAPGMCGGAAGGFVVGYVTHTASDEAGKHDAPVAEEGSSSDC